MVKNNNLLQSCDICFVTLPGVWASGKLPFYYLNLAGYLEYKNFKTEVLDFAPRLKEFYKKSSSILSLYQDNFFDKNLYFKKVIERLLILEPKFVGISIFTLDYFFAMELAGEIKKHLNCKIVMGNVHASLFPEDCIFENSPVDFAVIGEGEETLAQLLKAGQENTDPKNVPGLCFFADNKPFRTGSREVIDIDNLALTPYCKLDMEYYLKPRELIRNLIMSGVDIFTGRGCPYFCSFCAANSIYKAQGVVKKVRYQSLDSVFANIENLVKTYKIDGFYILDDTFTVSEERVLEFCKRIKPFKLYWGADTRVNLINPKMLKAMKESGCIQLDFGVETGSPEMLKRVLKGITIEQTIKAFQMCKEAGIRTLANILINLPGEEESHIKETEDLLKIIRPTVINVSILKPYPATPIFDEYVKMNHVEYIKNLKKFLAGDLSIFKLCKHNLDLQNLNKKLRSYAGKSWGQFFINIKISLSLIIKSKRRGQYLIKISKLAAIKLLSWFRKIAYQFFKYFNQ